MKWTACLVLIAAAGACGLDASRADQFESEEKQLLVESPIDSARLDTFGFPGDDMRQRVWVKLEDGVSVSEVFRMSVFAPLHPGISGAAAVEVLGDPDSVTTDGCGEEWLSFKRPTSTIVVGCDHDTGFAPLSTICYWRLYAELDPGEVVIAPVLQPVVNAALAEDRRITLRTMVIQNADYSESVTYFFDSLDGGPTATWRNGSGESKRAFCFGK